MQENLEFLRSLSSTFDLVFLVIYMFLVPRALHMMQQESYQNDGMIRWIGKNLKKAFKKTFIGFVLCLAVFMLSTIGLTLLIKNEIITETYDYFAYIPTIIAFVFMAIYNIVLAIQDHLDRKKPKSL